MSLQPEPPIVHYFLQLPVEITRSIFNEYLKGNDKNKYALLQTTEKFNLLRKQIIYLKLNWIDSQQFYLNREYREKILSCIVHPQCLVIECLRCGCPDSIDLKYDLTSSSIKNLFSFLYQ